jgi:hypothetical protein
MSRPSFSSLKKSAKNKKKNNFPTLLAKESALIPLFKYQDINKKYTRIDLRRTYENNTLL